ncbi:DUF4158 domain-containing protein [Streptosporangium sp. NPDC087985]|uniref:DUF4158 domain-containing protein n=1 Tax=Streptosporangium sp. NPDC087985 TaxID=3366196 RepID=UPI00382DFFC6
MPVEFLTDEQAEVYGTFTEVPTRPELERFFFLDDDDRDLIALRRTEVHRLGIALQICTVRYVGRFLGEDPLAVPWEAVEYLAAFGLGRVAVSKVPVRRMKTLAKLERASKLVAKAGRVLVDQLDLVDHEGADLLG